MSDYLVLAPITFILVLGAIVGFYAKYRESRESRTADSMRVSFDLSDTQSERLRQEADRLGIEPSTLARMTLTYLLDDDFHAAVGRALQEKADLYRRPA
jgi:hypothetical protein